MTEPSTLSRPDTADADADAGLLAQLVDPAVRADPYPVLARLREARVVEPVPGTFVVSRYADVRALLRDRRVASDLRKSTAGAPFKDAPEPTFLTLDPPEHTRVRTVVVREFRPNMVERLRAHVQEIVDGLLDAATGTGTLEVVGDLAYPLPVTVICELLGVPRADEPRFQRWSALMARSLDGATLTPEQRDEMVTGAGELRAYMAELVAARRTEPQDDYVSLLVHARDGGVALTDGEICATLSVLLVGGHETTVNLIANATLQLLRRPELWERVRADPALVPGVVEETLRHDPPVHFRHRTCTEDLDVGGTRIPAGATILLMLGATGRDPEHFPDPDRFDPGRGGHDHLGFGGGPHFCVGVGLARMEAQLAIRALTQRLVGPRLVHDPPPYRHAAALRGPERLELALDGIRPR